MALRRLSENGCDSTNEDDISEQLCLLLREICFEEFRENDREIPIPDWDGPISPATKNELKGGKKRNVPILLVISSIHLLIVQMILKYPFTSNASFWVPQPVALGS
ncbi:MAG: hypothetical protein WBG50_29150 [Desulfomonilaceae bacterium]